MLGDEPETRELQILQWRVRPQLNRLELGETVVRIEGRSMAVLLALARQAGTVCAKQALLSTVWGDAFVTDEVLTHAVWELRKALGDQAKQPRFIETIPRKGYRLIAPVTWAPPPERLPGESVFHYRVVEKVGSGGMGTVYRAEDTRLERSVALKFLLPERTGDPKARTRLLREARAAAALEHPNIGVIHDVGEDPNGQLFIAMAYYPGPSLEQRIREAPLSVDEVARLGRQIASGLAAAHGQRIVHRDIKPANVILTADGRARIVDFGLAKLGAGSTLTLTRPGEAPGTVAYMAPEQLHGDAVDARCDLWALGVVLYEMLAGRLPFAGDSAASVVRAVLDHEPPSTQSLRADTPPALDALVAELLEKDPARRPQSAAGVAQRLGALVGAEVEPTVVVEVPEPARAEVAKSAPPEVVKSEARSKRSWRPTTIWLAIAASGLAVALSWMVWGTDTFRKPAAFSGAVSFSIKPPEGYALTEGSRNVPAVSPDGSAVLFIASDGKGRTHLWRRSLDQLEAEPILDASQVAMPFWSPDGKAFGFFSNRALRVALPGSGPPLTLAQASLESRGASWNLDDIILFAPSERDGIFRVHASGEGVRPVTKVDRDRGELGHHWPCFLSGGQHFLYFVASNDPEVRGVYATSLTGGGGKRLVDSGVSALVALGHLLFVRDGVLLAQEFDPIRLELTGKPRQILDSIGVSNASQLAASASANGVLAYLRGGLSNSKHLHWLDAAGRPLGPVLDPPNVRNPELSPDGRFIAAEHASGDSARVRVFDLDLGRDMKVGLPASTNLFPVWSPDSRTLGFVSNANGWFDLYRQGIDSADSSLLYASKEDKMLTDWSPDGSKLAYVAPDVKRGYDIFFLDLDSSPRSYRVVASEHDDISARFSPSGHLLAYASNESGRFEIYVRPLEARDIRCQLSTNGGYDPYWGDGIDTALYYLDPSGHLLRSTFRIDGMCEVDEPIRLFRTNIDTPGASRNNYAVTASGTKILLNAESPDTEANTIYLFVSLQSALRESQLAHPTLDNLRR